MAAITTIIAVAALATAGAAAYSGYQSRKDMKEANQNAAAEQRKAQGEQRALKFQEQAQERRNQIREERVRRAKILQASENTGVGDSSGAYGAVDGLSTQLNNNLGINAGRAVAGDRIGGYMQNAADFNLAAQQRSYLCTECRLTV
jgi:cell division protein FtsL